MIARFLFLFGLLSACQLRAQVESDIPADAIDRMTRQALTYLQAQQQEDGSFSKVQPHLQTGLVLLAALANQIPPSSDDVVTIDRAVKWLVDNAPSSGDLGDADFSVESHSICLVALLHALPTLGDDDLRGDALQLASRATRLLLRWQDRSSSGGSRGGWKMLATKGRENDRRASAWALYALRSAQLCGLTIPQPNLDRGAAYVLAAQKRESTEPRQLGGFSVDTEGLTVPSISAMGGWILAQIAPEATASQQLATWLSRHPPTWSGPNYFYTNFFRLRALYLLPGEEEAYRQARRQIYFQLKDHQLLDGSFEVPPGNAQNTVSMGHTFSTAMAVLILRSGDSRLLGDEGWHGRDPFQ